MEDILYWVFDSYWLHPVRAFISSRWDIKLHSKAFSEMIKHWSHIMPDHFLDKLIDMYIKPRLKREINEAWNPRDTENSDNRVENWLFPWFDILN